MQTHHAAALVFALMALPSFVFAGWLRGGRLPLAGGSGMDEGQRRRLDDRLARLMRMVGVLMLATAGGMALWGDQPARIAALILVVAVAVTGLSIAMVVAVTRARGGGGGGRG